MLFLLVFWKPVIARRLNATILPMVSLKHTYLGYYSGPGPLPLSCPASV